MRKVKARARYASTLKQNKYFDTLKHAYHLAWALTICKEISVKTSIKWYWYFLWHRKQERDWVVAVPFTKYQFLFSLEMKPGASNPNKRYRQSRSFRLKRETGNTARKVLLFFRKTSTGMNRSIWILPGISGFSNFFLFFFFQRTRLRLN